MLIGILAFEQLEESLSWIGTVRTYKEMPVVAMSSLCRLADGQKPRYRWLIRCKIVHTAAAVAVKRLPPLVRCETPDSAEEALEVRQVRESIAETPRRELAKHMKGSSRWTKEKL